MRITLMLIQMLSINVKVDPEWRDLWRNTYDAVIPGYHQNDEIKRMIAESYDLCIKK